MGADQAPCGERHSPERMSRCCRRTVFQGVSQSDQRRLERARAATAGLEDLPALKNAAGSKALISAEISPRSSI
jgi:hypothetical protein